MRKSKHKIADQLAQNEQMKDVSGSLTAEDKQSAGPSDATVQESAPSVADPTPKRRGRKPKSESQTVGRSVLKRAGSTKADKSEKTPLKHKQKEKTNMPADAEESIWVQYAGQELDVNELRKKVIDAHVEAGHRAGRIKKMDLYIKPEDQKVYYVINDKISGSIDF